MCGAAGLYLTLSSGQLALGSEGVDAEWRVETHPKPSPTVHQIEVPFGEEHLALQSAWRSDQSRGLMAVPGILSGQECEHLMEMAESVGFSPEREVSSAWLLVLCVQQYVGADDVCSSTWVLMMCAAVRGC